jgi:hypothetical protein
MPDGVRLAVDIHLPDDLVSTTKLPAILQFTPYWRRPEGGGSTPQQLRWVRQGYAVVVADVRGTGASFGRWAHPSSSRETQDLGDLIAWVAAQPWSSGRVGTIGGSYLGNTAQLAAVSGHPALRAVVPQFFDWDAYAEVVRFGGLPNQLYTEIWGEFMRQLNANLVPNGPGAPPAGARRGGVAPVDGDSGRVLLLAAVREHAGTPLFGPALAKVEFRDDPIAEWGNASIDDWLTYRQATALARTRVPIFGWVGWQDGATALGAISRFLDLEKVPQTVVIGPWNHGAFQHTSPYRPADTPPEPSPSDQTSEVLCFFERHLEAQARPPARREIVYYTLGEERWHRTAVWPPAGTKTERWYLGASGALTDQAPSRSGRPPASDRYQVDFTARTGRSSRWYSGVNGGDVIYPDRREEDRKLLVYESGPMERDVVMTGQPIATLSVSSTHDDGAVIVYQEDVDPSGQVRYLTEGALRLINRAESKAPYTVLAPYHSFRRADARPLVPGKPVVLRFGLIPTSVRFAKGHRIRIALAGADQDLYARLPAAGTPTLTVELDGRSFLDLPVAPR